MKLYKVILLFLFINISFTACGVKTKYNLNNSYLGDAKTFKVSYFKNYASKNPGSTFEPGLDRDFTLALQNRFQNHTNLDLVNNATHDLLYEGEIIEYRISPMGTTHRQTAAKNKLSITIQVRFKNNTKEDADFEQRFSFFFEYPANSQLSSVKSEAHEIIFERITQDIFNASLAEW